MAAFDGGDVVQNLKLTTRYKFCGLTMFCARIPRRK